MRSHQFFLLLTLTIAGSAPAFAQRYRGSTKRHSRLSNAPTSYAKYRPKAEDGYKVTEYFVNASVLGQKFFTSQAAGRIAVTFPYSTVTATEIKNYSFTGSGVNPLYHINPQGGLAMQAGTRQSYFDLAFGFGAPHNSYWSMGYGRTFNPDQDGTRILFLKATVSVGENRFATKLGRFDAQHVKVWALGKTIDSTFYEGSSSTYSRGHTVNTEFVTVSYKEKMFTLKPELAAEWHPFNTGFFVEAIIGYAFHFAEHGNLMLRAESHKYSAHTSKETGLQYPGTQLSYAGHSISSTPFSFQAIQFGIRIGTGQRSFRRKKN